MRLKGIGAELNNLTNRVEVAFALLLIFDGFHDDGHKVSWVPECELAKRKGGCLSHIIDFRADQLHDPLKDVSFPRQVLSLAVLAHTESACNLLVTVIPLEFGHKLLFEILLVLVFQGNQGQNEC